MNIVVSLITITNFNSVRRIVYRMALDGEVNA